MRAIVPATVVTLTVVVAATAGCRAPEVDAAATCAGDRAFFEQQLWPQVLGRICVSCHAPDGVAALQHARLRLLTPAYPGFLDASYASVRAVAALDDPLLVEKPLGHYGHGGGAVIPPDGPEHRLLVEMVARVRAPDPSCPDDPTPAAARVALRTLDAAATLRKAALDLAGRLPRPDERTAVAAGGEAALDDALAAITREPAFFDRLQELWNDVLLTRALEGHALAKLYDTDYPTKYWFSPTGNLQVGLSPEQERQRTASDRAIAAEPLALIAHVVREHRPFREVLTAAYTVVNPYSARVYGLDLDRLGLAATTDPTEVREAQLTIHRGGHDTPIPHAGVLTSLAWLLRYPTTATNLDRKRARTVLQTFLGTDILALDQRPVDLTQITAANPTRDEPGCRVCHATLDPIAGTFRSWDLAGQLDADFPWPDDLPPPGIHGVAAGTPYPEATRWLAARVVEDPRFAPGVVRTMVRLLVGRDLAQPPVGEAVEIAARIAAWRAQELVVARLVDEFVASDEDLALLVRRIVESPLYRAVGGVGDPRALAGFGTGRLLSPEALNRKIVATTGLRWWHLYDHRDLLLTDYRLLYGGIDSDLVVDRLVEPSGVVANIAWRMASELACWAAPWELSRPAATRRLLPYVEIDTPLDDDRAVRRNLVHLHDLLLGETLAPDDPEIDRALALLRDTVAELRAAGATDILPEACQVLYDRDTGAARAPADWFYRDPGYSIRGWIAVLTYLFADWKFLYQE